MITRRYVGGYELAAISRALAHSGHRISVPSVINPWNTGHNVIDRLSIGVMTRYTHLSYQRCRTLSAYEAVIMPVSVFEWDELCTANAYKDILLS